MMILKHQTLKKPRGLEVARGRNVMSIVESLEESGTGKA